jgi:hypothetical protein
MARAPKATIRHREQQAVAGPPGYQTHKESHYRRSDVIRWLADQGVLLAICQSDCGGIYRLNAFTTVEDDEDQRL